MAYHYLDMMKRVLPDNAISVEDRCDGQNSTLFYVFGSYDLLHVDNGSYTSATQLKQKHEERHKISWQYERQPIFLYCLNDRRFEQIFDLDGGYNDYPLILTLIQLDKRSLVRVKDYHIDDILQIIQTSIDQISEENESSELVKNSSLVAWNMGGTDLIIISRVRKLCSIATLLNRLSSEGIRVKEQKIPVFSMSSHCAIAYKDIEDFRDNCIKWLTNDDSVELNAYFETANGFDGVINNNSEGLNTRMVLGERDFQLAHEGTLDKNRIRQSNFNIIEALIDMQMRTVCAEDPYAYRASYIVPSISLDDIISAAHRIESVEWSDKDSLVFDLLSEIENKVKGSSKLYNKTALKIAGQICSVKNSLLGLKKYSYRLEASIQQHDLFIRVEKIYDMIGCILKRYNELIDGSSISERAVIDEMLTSLLKIVTELQHLFTVLALSPHTYMETYSSSMRSLNACSKLWSAYYGCLDTIEDILCNDGQKCEVLLTPYRDRMSSNELLFTKASEKDTLIHLQMNFSLMFNKKQAIFMLAHEMGHHLGDHRREDRIRYMTEYLIGLSMRHIAGSMVSIPLWQLTSIISDDAENKTYTSDSDINEPQKYKNASWGVYFGDDDQTKDNLKRLFPLISAKRKSPEESIDEYFDESRELRRIAKHNLKTEIDALTEKFISNFKESDSFQNEYKTYNYFARPVSEAYKDQAGSTIMELLKSSSNKVMETVRESALEYLKSIEGKYDPVQVTQLKTAWRYWKENEPMSSLLYPEDIDNDINNTITIFREIHADIVAVRIINIETMEDYLEITNDFSHVFPPIYADGNNMIRIFAVINTIFNSGDISEDGLYDTSIGIKKWMVENSEFADDIWVEGLDFIYAFVTSICPESVLLYAQACDKAVCKLLDDKRDNLELKRIRDWYKSENIDLAEDIWHFWNCSINDKVVS